MHVPPGINSFNSAEGVSRGGPPVTFWQPELTSRFVQLIRRYRATIRAVFAGHTHMDDFRVIRLDSEPALLCKIAPAISPIFGNNPGYQVYQYDRGTGILRDYQTYNLTNLADSGSAAAPAIGRWALEYDFREAYGYPELSARTVARLSVAMATDATVRERFSRYYGMGAAPEFTERTFAIYRCAIANIRPAEFLMCLSGVPTPKMPLPHPDRQRSQQRAAHP